MTQAVEVADGVRINDKFWSRVTVNQWPRPEKVVLLEPGFSTLVSMGSPYTSHSRIQLDWRDPESSSSRAYVKPPASLLETFMGLADSADERIQEFAARYGGLSVFCEVKDSGHEELKFVTEFCDVWRYFAGSIRALLRIRATLHKRVVGTPADWEFIGNCPAIMAKIQKPDRVDDLSPMPIQGEALWTVMAHFVKKGSDRDRAMWARLLNALLELGRVRPWVRWDAKPGHGLPYLAYGTPSLFSHLALQTCLLAVGREALALCSYCGFEYLPRSRAPKPGLRSFCPDCRNKGVPVRLAQRDRRARQHNQKGNR